MSLSILSCLDFLSGGRVLCCMLMGNSVSALLLCCCLCLGCIPYMASWFKDCEHSCGACGKLLAVCERSGRTEVVLRN